MARARRRWMRERGMFDPAHLVFIDETAANTKMVRRNGRCARGERLVARVPHGHWQTVTFVAALRHNAMTAPCVVNGAMNGETFLAYVEQCLAPTLKNQSLLRAQRCRAQRCLATFLWERCIHTRVPIKKKAFANLLGKVEFVINAGAECSFAKRNNSVITGTNPVSKTFTRNDVMEVAMRTYILAIATAALFAIPTAPAFSESGHHRYYNRYEGLYDRYESGRCRESRAACAHTEKLGEQVMGNCRRFRELCD